MRHSRAKISFHEQCHVFAGEEKARIEDFICQWLISRLGSNGACLNLAAREFFLVFPLFTRVARRLDRIIKRKVRLVGWSSE